MVPTTGYLEHRGMWGLIVVGMQSPNERSVWIVGGCAIALALGWCFFARHCFCPPIITISKNERAL